MRNNSLAVDLARAFCWQALIDSGTYSNTVEPTDAIEKKTRLGLKTHPADLARAGDRPCHPHRDLAEIRLNGNAAQGASDALGGPEKAVRGGVKR